MLVIDPNVCIDCGVCIIECPVNAIKQNSPELLIWFERASRLSSIWPNITRRKSPDPEADIFKNQTDKFQQYVENCAMVDKKN
jgi:ferredoxin